MAIEIRITAESAEAALAEMRKLSGFTIEWKEVDFGAVEKSDPEPTDVPTDAETAPKQSKPRASKKAEKPAPDQVKAEKPDPEQAVAEKPEQEAEEIDPDKMREEFRTKSAQLIDMDKAGAIAEVLESFGAQKLREIPDDKIASAVRKLDEAIAANS